MAQTIMYPGIDNSPKTIITGEVTATDTTIPIESAAALPEGPNLATLGTGDNAEVLLYTSIADNVLQGCVRGVGGTARVWAAGTNIYRAYTNKDHQIFIDNIRDLDSNKLDKTGSAENLTAAFTAAASRSNISSGEKISISFGKISKWFTDLKALAFKATVGTSDISDGAVTNARMANMSAQTIKGNSASSAASPTDLSAADVRTLLNVSDGADVTGKTLEAAPAIDTVTDNDRMILEDMSASANSRTKHILWSSVKSMLKAYFDSLYSAKSHASTHTSTGSDKITPADIGAATPASELTAILPASGWAGNTNTVSDLTKVTVNSKGAVSVADSASAEQRTAARAAQLHKTGQAAGSITITADGVIPSIDIPITILLVD